MNTAGESGYSAVIRAFVQAFNCRVLNMYYGQTVHAALGGGLGSFLREDYSEGRWTTFHAPCGEQSLPYGGSASWIPGLGLPAEEVCGLPDCPHSSPPESQNSQGPLGGAAASPGPPLQSALRGPTDSESFWWIESDTF